MRKSLTTLPEFDTIPAPEVLERRFLLPRFTGEDRRLPSWKVPETGLVRASHAAITDNGTITSFPASGGAVAAGVTVVALFSMLYNNASLVLIVGTTSIRLGYGGLTQIRNISTLTGPTISLSSGARVSFTVWNGTTVLMTSQETGLIAIDLAAKTYAVVADAPVGFGHVTVMNGRVLLSDSANVPGRVQWCAKFDYEQWNSAVLGTGFEDRTPTVNTVGTVFGVYPETDTIGIVVRDGSVEQIEATDNFDAPFRFTRKFSHVQFFSPRTLAKGPVGVYAATYTNVVEITLGQIREIGDPLNITATTVPTNPIGVYLPHQDVYMVGPLQNENLVSTVYMHAYWRKHQAWTTVYIDPSSICASHGPASSGYSSLNGTYDSLSGTLDTLGQSVDGYSSIIYSNGTNVYTTNTPAGAVGGFSWLFPQIEPSKPENSIQVVSVHLGLRTTITSAFTLVEAATGTTYGTFTPSATVNPQVFNLWKPLTSRWVQFRLNSNASTGADTGGGFELDYVTVRYTEGPMEVSGHAA